MGGGGTDRGTNVVVRHAYLEPVSMGRVRVFWRAMRTLSMRNIVHINCPSAECLRACPFAHMPHICSLHLIRGRAQARMCPLHMRGGGGVRAKGTIAVVCHAYLEHVWCHSPAARPMVWKGHEVHLALRTLSLALQVVRHHDRLLTAELRVRARLHHAPTNNREHGSGRLQSKDRV